MTSQTQKRIRALVAIAILTALVVYLRSNSKKAESLVFSKQITCLQNLKQIANAFQIWELDNHQQLPWNVSIQSGGSKEFWAPGIDGVDTNAAIHFQILSNELTTPLLFICPHDKTKKAAATFQTLRLENITYHLNTAANTNVANSKQVLVVCPIDGNTAYSDGSVVGKDEETPDKNNRHPMGVQ